MLPSERSHSAPLEIDQGQSLKQVLMSSTAFDLLETPHQKTMPNRTLQRLASSYTAEIDNVTKEEWYQLLQRFEDANIYQTWSYAEATWGLENTSHLVLKKDSSVVAIAQVRVTRVPFLKIGIAYILRGPAWRLKHFSPDREVLRQTLKALRNEYVCKRGFLLRVAPWMFGDGNVDESRLFQQENYQKDISHGSKVTILMDLSSPLEELRSGLNRNWKRHLKTAAACNLHVTEGEGDELFKAVIDIYREMVQRKAFLEPNDIEKFRRAQALLPDGFKMKIAVCRSSEGPCAGLIWSEIGGIAIELFAATRGAALSNGAAYLLRWRLVERLKCNGFRLYNLNGINPATNPGVYQFKSGLAGKAGTEIAYLGVFEARGTASSTYCVKIGQKVLDSCREIRSRIRSRRRTKKLSE